jgi:hypothetical protein
MERRRAGVPILEREAPVHVDESEEATEACLCLTRQSYVTGQTVFVDGGDALA